MTANIEDVQSLWPEPFADAHAMGAICLYRSLADTSGLQTAVPKLFQNLDAKGCFFNKVCTHDGVFAW